MNSVCGVNSMGRFIMKTDITGQLVGIFNTANTQINTIVFNVRVRLTFMPLEGCNEKKITCLEKNVQSKEERGGLQSTKINEVV